MVYKEQKGREVTGESRRPRSAEGRETCAVSLVFGRGSLESAPGCSNKRWSYSWGVTPRCASLGGRSTSTSRPATTGKLAASTHVATADGVS